MATAEQSIAQAMQHINSGRLGQAKEVCGELIEREPQNPAALHALGLISYMQRDYAEAIARITHVVQIDRRNPQYFSNLGEALRRARRPQEALEAFEKSLALLPEFLKAHLGVGNCLRDLGRRQEAIAKFRLALAINPNFAEGYHYLGATFIELRRTADAIPLLRKTVALRPAYADAEITLASALESTGQVEESLTIYRTILERDPKNVAVHNNVGNILKNLGRTDEAVTHYQRALAIDPNHTSAYYNLSHVKLGEDDDTLARMEKLLEGTTLPEDERSNIHFAVGKIHDDLGHYEKAFAHFSDGNALDTRGEPFRADNHSAAVDQLIGLFSAEFFETRKGCGSGIANVSY